MEYETTLHKLSNLHHLSSEEAGVDCGKERDFTFAIDHLVFRLPNYDFDTATSSTRFPYEKVKDIIPNELLEYLDGDPNGRSYMQVFACSRSGKDVSVAIAMGQKRICFAIDQQSQKPQLYFEERGSNNSWNIIDGVYELDWPEFETGFFIVSSVVESLDTVK